MKGGHLTPMKIVWAYEIQLWTLADLSIPIKPSLSLMDFCGSDAVQTIPQREIPGCIRAAILSGRFPASCFCAPCLAFVSWSSLRPISPSCPRHSVRTIQLQKWARARQMETCVHPFSNQNLLVQRFPRLMTVPDFFLCNHSKNRLSEKQSGQTQELWLHDSRLIIADRYKKYNSEMSFDVEKPF